MSSFRKYLPVISLLPLISHALTVTYPTTGSYWVDSLYNPLHFTLDSSDPPANSFQAILVNITEMQREADNGWNYGVTAYSPTGLANWNPADVWPHVFESVNLTSSTWACNLHTKTLQGTDLFQINITSLLVKNFGELLAFSAPFSVKLPGATPELPNDPSYSYVPPTTTAMAADQTVAADTSVAAAAAANTQLAESNEVSSGSSSFVPSLSALGALLLI